MLYTTYLPTPVSGSVQESNSLRAEVVRLKREMQATSSQDEFAKWAKLRRQHDKAEAKYNERASAPINPKTRQDDLELTFSASLSATSLKSHRASFTRLVTTTRWLGTNGLRFLIQWWFAKTPMFWIPKDWVPYYVAWLLSFPRAPVGAVSIQIWGSACATVVQMVGAAAVSGWVLLQEHRGEGRGRGERVAMGAEGRTGGGGGGEEKKEL
ncbi:MAG: hypothetical protein LQ350_007174 [Teloschistes chrysophthalmus]|nr:MAG: hypothetical protein LQ350_007174 [Niorma chrysophthalma]